MAMVISLTKHKVLTYVDYKISLIDESDFTRAVDIRTDNIVATGITYQF